MAAQDERRRAVDVCPCCGRADGGYWVFPADWRYTAPLEPRLSPRPETADETVEWLKDRRRRERTDRT